MDANLVFNEVTSSFQTVTIQGQFTYRIHNPKRAAELLNFTMNPFTHMHVSNDPDRLAQRITNIIQMETRGEIQQRPLEEVLTQYETMRPFPAACGSSGSIGRFCPHSPSGSRT